MTSPPGKRLRLSDPSTMASTSASPVVQKSYEYDVFLSFRGDDTRKTFVDHLYLALNKKGIRTYKDDVRIKKGEKISEQLIRSIEESRFFIIVFSKNYADSSWCLQELVKIMECQQTKEHTAYPIFYDVEPTELRKQIGAVGEALKKHVEKEDAEKWRDALKEAAGLAGWDLKNMFDGYEAKLIQKCVQDISLKPHFTSSSIDGKLVGMENRVSHVVSALKLHMDDVRMIGIWGMGGGGKTTLAKAIFDRISTRFDGKKFVENVREGSKGSGMKKLQKQILRDVLDDKSIAVSDEFDGRDKMKKMLPRRKVLVVLDDVDHVNQLEALAGDRDWFKTGSRIIITTRDKHVLVAHRVPSENILDVSLLSPQEAICLFNRYAFRTEFPCQRYEELSKKVVYYAAGLPLTIKVLGSFLMGRSEREWEVAIERLETIPPKETLEILELSYDGLDKDYKEIFLEVACILKGEEKDVAIGILEGCGFNAQIGLEVLEEKSLLTISSSNRLKLHDQIEKMGINIVRRVSDEPNMHSRLWVDEEVEYILENELGTDATKSIKVMISNFPPETIMKGLKKMKGLRFLYVYGDDDTIWDFDQAKHKYQYLPNSLRSVNWLRYPFWCLPKTFEANMLVCLKMGLSNISQLWEGDDIKVLNKLKILDLSFTKLKTFDLQITPKLERLDLAGCEDFVELLMPVGHVKLSYLNLSFSKVSKLNLESIPNLGSLDLSSCNKVSSLNLGLTPYLESLVLQDCENFVELHIPIESPKLKFLDLSGSKVININLKLIPNLESLHLAHCEEFAELHMLVELPKLKFLDLRGSKVISLNLGLTPHLEWLDLEGCYNLQEIHDPMGCLKKLKSLNLIGCLRFQDVLFNESNTFLGLESHSILELIADPLDICPLHPNSTLPKFYFKCSFQREDINPLPPKKHNSFNLCACTNIESFYETLCGLQHLTRLTLVAHIPEVPKDLGQLKSLVELNLRMKEIKHLPDSICMLKHLTRLELYSCCLLEKLPDDIDRLERLERLDLMGCKSLQYIPNNICNMKRLLRLDLHFCIGVKKLPEQVGHLKCLQILILEEAGVSCLPQSISQIRGLRITGSRRLLESSGFTSLVETYTSSGQFFAYTET